MPINHLSISNLPAVYFDGCYRVLGCLPSTQQSLVAFPKFATSFRMLDPGQWQEIDLTHFNLPILNQGMTSSCVGHGTCSAAEMAWVQSERPLHEFNPFFLYGLINGGRDAGASISDAMNALMRIGICSKNAIPPGMMFENQFPQSAFDDAKSYKALQAFHLTTFEEICSAISLGFPTPLGILVGGNFAGLDGEGVAPLPNGGGGGHCVLGMGLHRSPRYGWVIKVQNSWGENFGAQVGMSGHCYLRRESFNYMPIDAFALQSMIN